MFIAALFTIAKNWKQPKCPSTDDWFKKSFDFRPALLPSFPSQKMAHLALLVRNLESAFIPPFPGRLHPNRWQIMSILAVKLTPGLFSSVPLLCHHSSLATSLLVRPLQSLLYWLLCFCSQCPTLQEAARDIRLNDKGFSFLLG